MAKVQAKLICTGISRYFMENNCGKRGKLLTLLSCYVVWHRIMNSAFFRTNTQKSDKMILV
jgi:hypothetical protein